MHLWRCCGLNVCKVLYFVEANNHKFNLDYSGGHCSRYAATGKGMQTRLKAMAEAMRKAEFALAQGVGLKRVFCQACRKRVLRAPQACANVGS